MRAEPNYAERVGLTREQLTRVLDDAERIAEDVGVTGDDGRPEAPTVYHLFRAIRAALLPPE